MENFFPVKKNETIIEFMNNDDGRFEDRAHAFTAYISGICDPTETNLRTFSDSLRDLLFHRDYLKDHRWVFTQYAKEIAIKLFFYN